MFTAYVNWSIYVRTSNKRKLLSEHLPPITAALEQLEFDWQIVTEDENPGLFRLITFQNFRSKQIEDIVVPVLRRAYRLADNWTIAGLDDLASGKLQYVSGSWNMRKPTSRPPALESMMFQIEPGRILSMTADGAWPVVDEPPQVEPLKPGQIRHPAPPDQGRKG